MRKVPAVSVRENEALKEVLPVSAQKIRGIHADDADPGRASDIPVEEKSGYIF